MHLLLVWYEAYDACIDCNTLERVLTLGGRKTSRYAMIASIPMNVHRNAVVSYHIRPNIELLQAAGAGKPELLTAIPPPPLSEHLRIHLQPFLKQQQIAIGRLVRLRVEGGIWSWSRGSSLTRCIIRPCAWLLLYARTGHV